MDVDRGLAAEVFVSTVQTAAWVAATSIGIGIGIIDLTIKGARHVAKL